MAEDDRVKAIVLVGGEGTRLRPLTYSTPKQLLPVVEVPMLERVLGWLAGHGIKEAILSMGYRPDAFLSAYPNSEAAGVSLCYAVEPKPLDTAGAIAFAAAQGRVDDTFVVINGDVLTDLDLSALIGFHRSAKARATIALTPVDDPSRFGVVVTESDGRVLAFVEKPPANEAPTNLINAGTYVMEPEVLDAIPVGRRVSVERETFPMLASSGSLFAMACDAYWLDTGTPLAYLQAHRDLLDEKRPGPPAPGARRAPGGWWELGVSSVGGTVDPGSFVGTGVLVEDGATVVRSVLGGSCVIRSKAHVQDAVIMAGCEIGPGAEVWGSIVGRGASVGQGARITELTVVGDHAQVPARMHLEAARYPRP